MKKTLFILGAGASKDIYEYFPTGYELIKDINYRLITQKKAPSEGAGYISDMINQILPLLENQNKDELVKQLKGELWKVVEHYEWHKMRGWEEKIEEEDRKLMSIDYFISKQSKDLEQVAKLSIAHIIKGAEEAYAAKANRNTNWIDILLQKLKHFDSKEVLKNIEFVTFNYDRSLEYLLGKKWTSEEQQGIVQHVYGALGKLEDVPFSEPNNVNNSKKLSLDLIRLMFSERRTSWDWKEKQFEQIYFLGFGFDKVNMDILNLGKFKQALKIGTGKGLSRKIIETTKWEHGVILIDEYCTDFCDKYVGF